MVEWRVEGAWVLGLWVVCLRGWEGGDGGTEEEGKEEERESCWIEYRIWI